MKETVLEYLPRPYDLHDRTIAKLKLADGDLKIWMEDGLTVMREPYDLVAGYLLLQRVDLDDCQIFLLSKEGGFGKFKGKKLRLKDFFKKYKKCTFLVQDELHGYKQVQFSGLLHLPGKDQPLEYNMTLRYKGDFLYMTDEEAPALPEADPEVPEAPAEE
ncbi:MAG: hypothetical protein IJ751_08700 [Oscillospiraceae bacterium]|nr:hypothetical protein [Oscillospiraceae bacterium]